MKEKNISIELLNREDLMDIFNCGKTKMNEIMHSNQAPLVFYIGRDYYITREQLTEYFNNNDTNSQKGKKNKKIDKNKKYNGEDIILNKADLMSLFKMGRTKFLNFIKLDILPVKIIGQEYYITQGNLRDWFDKVAGTKIEI